MDRMKILLVSLAFGLSASLFAADVKFIGGSFQYGENHYERELEGYLESLLKGQGVDEKTIPLSGVLVFGKKSSPIGRGFSGFMDTVAKVIKKRHPQAAIAGNAALCGAYLTSFHFAPSLDEYSFLIIGGRDVAMKSVSIPKGGAPIPDKINECLKQVTIPEMKFLCFFLPGGFYNHPDTAAALSATRSAMPSDAAFLCLAVSGNDPTLMAVSIGGKIEVAYKAASSFKSVAGPFKVTKANGNTLTELDSKSAWQVYIEKGNLIMDGLKNPLAANDLAFCVKEGERLLPLGQTYDEKSRSFRLLNPVKEGAEVYLGKYDRDLKMAMVSALAEQDLARYRGKQGALIFLNGAANWYSYGKSEEEFKALQAAVGTEMPVCGFYARDYLLMLPDTGSLSRFNNTHVGMALLLLVQ